MTRALLLIPLLALGCELHDSDEILTSAMSARISAVANGQGFTDITADLYLGRVGDYDRIELEGDDELWVYGPAGEMQRMAETRRFGTATYAARFEVEDEDSEFIVAFERTLDEGAPGSRLIMPRPFEQVSTSELAFSRSQDDLTVSWQPSASGDDIDWTLRGDCIETIYGAPNGDPGELVISAGSVLRPATASSASCDVLLELRRNRAGQLDPGYGQGGTITATQYHTLALSSTP